MNHSNTNEHYVKNIYFCSLYFNQQIRISNVMLWCSVNYVTTTYWMLCLSFSGPFIPQPLLDQTYHLRGNKKRCSVNNHSDNSVAFSNSDNWAEALPEPRALRQLILLRQSFSKNTKPSVQSKPRLKRSRARSLAGFRRGKSTKTPNGKFGNRGHDSSVYNRYRIKQAFPSKRLFQDKKFQMQSSQKLAPLMGNFSRHGSLSKQRRDLYNNNFQRSLPGTTQTELPHSIYHPDGSNTRQLQHSPFHFHTKHSKPEDFTGSFRLGLHRGIYPGEGIGSYPDSRGGEDFRYPFGADDIRVIVDPPKRLLMSNSSDGSLTCRVEGPDAALAEVAWVHEDGTPVMEVSGRLRFCYVGKWRKDV